MGVKIVKTIDNPARYDSFGIARLKSSISSEYEYWCDGAWSRNQNRIQRWKSFDKAWKVLERRMKRPGMTPHIVAVKEV